MMAFTSTGTFLFMWIGFLLLMILGLSLVLLWAVRSRQFSDQDRARYLPLRSGIPESQDEREKRGGLHHDVL